MAPIRILKWNVASRWERATNLTGIMVTNQSGQPIDVDVREHLDAIDGTLHEQLEQDARLTSGVPDEQRGDDLGFIQMSGLTRPGLVAEAPQAHTPEDLDPSKPVNFYEAGVVDVDASMDPGSYDSAAADSEDLAAEKPHSETAKGLREILAQLGSESDTEPLPPEADPLPPPRAVEDSLDPQALVDAGGADLLRREVPGATEPAISAPPADEGTAPPDTRDGADGATMDDDITEEHTLKRPVEVPTLEAEMAAGDDNRAAADLKPPEALAVDGWNDVTDIESHGKGAELPSRDLEYEKAEVAPNSDPGAVPTAEEDALRADRQGGDPYDAMAEIDFLHTPSIDKSLRQSLAGEPGPHVEVPQGANALEESVAGAESGVIATGTYPTTLDPAHDVSRSGPASAPTTYREFEHTALPPAATDVSDASPAWLQPQEGPLLAPRQQRRSTSRRRSLRRRIRRWTIRVAFLLLLAAALAAAAWFVRDAVKPPINLYMEAQRLADQGQYAEASRRYEAFAARNRGDALRPAAEFEAAQVLSNLNPTGQDERNERNRRQLALYQAFVDNNPGHPKVARATRLIGQLQYDLGQHEDVVRNYRPELQVQDPASALPALRLVARAYQQLGEYDQAESAFLRASSMDGNLTTERDFEALADLYHQRATQATDPAARSDHYRKALEYLDHAHRSPTIDPALRERLRLKQSAWQTELAGDTPTTIPSEPQATDSSAAPDRAETGADGPAVGAVPERDIDPTAEAEYLERVTAGTETPVGDDADESAIAGDGS